MTQFTNLGTEKNLRGSKNSCLQLNCKKKYRENVFDFIDVEAVKTHIVYIKFANEISLLNFEILVAKVWIGRL